SGNGQPRDIVTDGTSLWVVDDAATDKVFKYSVSGALLGSWTITAGGGSPAGITLGPSAPAHLWVGDRASDPVHQLDNAVTRTPGSQAASSSFALAAGNTNPQGIADPPGGAPTPVRETTRVAGSVSHPGGEAPGWPGDHAAGWGWFIDRTPRSDSEFKTR